MTEIEGFRLSSHTPFLDKKLYTDTMYSSEKTPNLLRVGEEPTIGAIFLRVHDVIA